MERFIICLLISGIFSTSAWARKIIFPYMGRSFTLVLPDEVNKKVPLLVTLHGCKQDAQFFLEGSKLGLDAQKNNFAILLPEQSIFHNGDHCWNWFLSAQQRKIPGNEMSQIIGALEVVLSLYPLDRSRIFLAGMSAGAAMAHNLMFCYPEYFKGVALHSGISYKIAENLHEASSVLTSNVHKNPEYLGRKANQCSTSSRSQISKVLIIHGQNDTRVPTLHSETIWDVHEVWQDYKDDSSRNHSMKYLTEYQEMIFPFGYKAMRTDRLYESGFIERKLIIKELAHSWGGGKKGYDNFNPNAPSSNEFIMEFFQLTK